MNKLFIVFGLILVTLACAQACVYVNTAYTPFCKSVNAFPSKFAVTDLSGFESTQKSADSYAKATFEAAETNHGSSVSSACKTAYGKVLCLTQLQNCYIDRSTTPSTQSPQAPCLSLCKAAEAKCPTGFFGAVNVTDYCASSDENCYAGAAGSIQASLIMSFIAIVAAVMFSM